jgi:hypothetical protein
LGGLSRAEGEAAFFEGQALAGDGQAGGAVDDFEEAGGFLHAGDSLREEGPGEEAGLVEGRGVEVGGREGGEGRGDLGLVLLLLGQEMPAPVEGDGAFADGQIKLGAQESDDLEVRAVFVFEPDAQALALRGAQLLQFRIAADFSDNGSFHAARLAGGAGDVSPLPGKGGSSE